MLLEASEPEFLASIAWLWHWFKLDKSKWIPAEPIYVIPENIWIGFRRSILSTFNNDIQHHFSSPLIFHENRFIIHSTEGSHSVGISLNSIYHTILILYRFQQLKSLVSWTYNDTVYVYTQGSPRSFAFCLVFKPFRCGK